MSTSEPLNLDLHDSYRYGETDYGVGVGEQQESAAAGEDTLKHAEDALQYKLMAWGENEEEDVKVRPGELEWAEDVEEKKWVETHLEDEEDEEGMEDGNEMAASDVGEKGEKRGEKMRKEEYSDE